MRAAVVILNWNTKSYLERFLPALIESVKGYDSEVIVADSGSTDGSMQMMEEHFPSVRRLPLGENFGFTGGYNRAFEETCSLNAEYFVLINSDIEVSPSWLEPLLAHMDAHPDCGACAPKLLSWHKRDTFEYAGAAGGYMDSLGYTFCRGRVLQRLEPDCGQYDNIKDVFWATGACLMVRSTLFKDLGGLDDRFFAHFEEIDLCWRMQLAGYRITVVPESKVWHLGGGTLPSGSPYKLRLNYRNTLLTLSNCLPGTYAENQSPTKALRHAHRTIRLRIMLDWCSAIVYLLKGKLSWAKAVLQAHKEFRQLRREPDEKSIAAAKPMAVKLYPGWILPTAVLCPRKTIKITQAL